MKSAERGYLLRWFILFSWKIRTQVVRIHPTRLHRYFQWQDHHRLAKVNHLLVPYQYCYLLPALRELSLSCTIAFLPFFSPTFHETAQTVAQTKRRYCWKGSNAVNLVLCVNSGSETGFRTEYRCSEGARKSALRASPLFEVNLEFVQNKLRN